MRRITIIAAALATAALATTYIQTSSTGTAPWKPVKDSVSRAHLADSALKADSSRAAWKADSARTAWFAHTSAYADSSRVSWLADSARAAWKADSARIAWFAHAATYADSSRVSGLSDSAKRAESATWTPLSDSSRVSGLADSARASGISDSAKALYHYIPINWDLHGMFGTVSSFINAQGPQTGWYSNEEGYPSAGLYDGRLALGVQGAANGQLSYDSSKDAIVITPNIEVGGVAKAASFVVENGDASQFLKADGSLDTNHYLTTSGSVRYSDSSRASHISDSTKKIPGSTVYRYLMTQANGSVSAGALYDSAGKLFSPESLVVGTQSSSATIGVNSRNSVITGYYMMDANKKRWGLARGALSDSFLLRAYTPSEAVIDTPLAFGVNAGDSGRITRPFKFSSGLRVLGGIAGTADSARAAGTAANSLALGGIAAAQYGTLAKDTTISRKVVSDSLTANTRAWTTLAAAKSSIHDSLAVERTFDTAVSRNVAHDTATALRTYVGSASTTGNAATATKLAAARTIGMSGDVAGTATAFDGTANITIPTTLPTLLTAGSAGSATSVPTLTWDAKGRLTAAGSAAISIPHTRISDWGTYINQPLLTTSSPTFGNASIGTMVGYPTVAWFGYSGLNVGTNYSGFYQTYVSDIGIAALSGHGVYLQVAQTQVLDILGNGIIAHQPISGNLTGTASNASALGGVAASSYLLASTAADTYLPLSGGTMSGNLLGGTPYNIGASSNWWGSIYATTIYESNVALSDKYLGINGTASNASALGGVNSDNFVQGNGSGTWGRRTTQVAGSTAFTQGLPSGFYDNDVTGVTPNNNWAYLINAAFRGSSAGNQYQFQLAAGFGNKHDTRSWGAENYWVRVINPSGVGDWRTLIHSANYPSFNNFTSGLSTTTLTASGLITANGGISGDLTGHASLDIPLTGSIEITGPLIPRGSTYTLGDVSNTWQVFGNLISASTGFEGNLTGNVTGNVTGHASLDLPLTGGTISGALAANGGLGLKSTQVTGSSSYAVSHSDCGTIIFQNNTYGVNVTLGTSNNVGDWIISCSTGGINISGVSAKYKGVTYTNSASLASATANAGVLMCLWDGTYWWIG